MNEFVYPPHPSGFNPAATATVRHEDNDSDNEAVVNPHDHDVLCGRGGLTNNHRGNAWYRRLVRSNRALYKSSPKHTKLLVSKAIVQAVINQNPKGRFLECNRSTGLWYPVAYKKAVDKTSQALRERDRDDEDVDDGLSRPMTVPSLQPSMYAMAQHAMQNVVQECIRKPPPLDEAPPPPTKRLLEPSTSWSWSNKRRKTESEGDDLMPLPPQPLQARTSSMFRFFTETKNFLVNMSSTSDSSPPPPPPPSLSPTPLQKQQPYGGSAAGLQRQAVSASQNDESDSSFQFRQQKSLGLQFSNGNGPSQSHFPPGMESYHFRPESGSAYSLDSTVQSQLQSQLQYAQGQYSQLSHVAQQQLQLPASSYEGHDSVVPPPPPGFPQSILGKTMDVPVATYEQRAPQENSNEGVGLTRLTTQVSDWLQSFYPLQRAPSGDVKAPSLANAPAAAPPTEAAPPPPVLTESVSSVLMKLASSPSRFLSGLTTFLDRSSTSRFFVPSQQQQQQQQQYQNMQMFDMPSQMFGTSHSLMMPGNNNGMMSQPSLTMTTMMNNSLGGQSLGSMTQSMEGSTLAPPTLGRPTRNSKAANKRSLLDDYEETPLETRLRTVPSR